MATETMRAAVLSGVGAIEIRGAGAAARPRRGAAAPGPWGSAAPTSTSSRDTATTTPTRAGERIPLEVEPQVLGHEIVATVVECGPGVVHVQRGDDVVVDQGVSCVSVAREPRCEDCETGDSHQCAFYREHGITGLPGGLAEYLTVPAVNTIPVHGDVAREHAALTEPLGCIVHASDMVARAHARYTLDSTNRARRVRTVLVSGAGPAGLLFVQYLRRALGWQGRISWSDPNPLKRALAARFEAEPLEFGEDEDVVAAVQERPEGTGWST